jgi:[ribosomal protein S5]-alanine N-acetyltransferase
MNIDKSKLYFETDRLIIRLFKPFDASQIVENYKDKVYSQNIPNLPYPYTLENANDFIKKAKKSIVRKKDPKIQFAIFSKEDNRVIGGMTLSKIDFKNKKCESGSSLSKKYWGKKYIYEAKLEIYKYAFNVLKLNKIYSFVLSYNLRSKKHLEKLGFREVGFFKKDYFHNNKFVNVFRLDLLKNYFKYKDLKKKLLK